MEKALEFFYFDFEFADEPSDTSLMANADVFEVDPNFPDMFITDSRGYSEVKKRNNSANYSLCYCCCLNWCNKYNMIFLSIKCG